MIGVEIRWISYVVYACVNGRNLEPMYEKTSIEALQKCEEIYRKAHAARDVQIADITAIAVFSKTDSIAEQRIVFFRGHWSRT